jgi:hypothetical protein
LHVLMHYTGERLDAIQIPLGISFFKAGY